MKRAAAIAALLLALTGCASPVVPGPGNGYSGWSTTTDPDTGRTFRCYWWQPAGGGGGTLWCYEPQAGAR